MLQDMRYSSIIGRIGLEAYRENIVLVFPGDMEVLGPGFVMSKAVCSELELGHLLGALDSESMQLRAWLEVMLKTGCSRIPPQAS